MVKGRSCFSALTNHKFDKALKQERPREASDPNAEQCGWLKDKFGLSWQVWPTAIGEMMTKGTPEQIARVTEAFLQMKKFDIATLRRAYKGE